MGTRKNFFEIYRKFGHAPSRRFPSPDLERSAVAGQVCQSGNMIFTQGISLVVVVTGDTFVGLATLITKAIISLSLCLLALTYIAMRALSAQKQSQLCRHCKFYHQRLFISIPFYLTTSLVRVEPFYQVSAEPYFDWLPAHLLSRKTYVLNFVL
jgi:hypothetical protein